MQKVGILGGSRFIGYHLVWALYWQGYEITLFNRGKTIPPCPLPADVKHVCGDRNHPDDLHALFCKDFDFIIDLSGYTPAQIEPIAGTYRDNIGHYIFCSTSSVYKVPPVYCFNEESQRTFMRGTYGGDKALVEDLLLRQSKENKWAVTIFRPQGVFGPHDAHQAWFVFYRILHKIPVSVRPQKNYQINFLYIEDLVRTFLSAMNNPISHGSIYNLAGDDITSQTEFIEMCAKACSCTPLLYFVKEPYYDDIKVGMPWLEYDLVADNRKVKKELKMNFTPLAVALKETLEWLLKHPEHPGYDWYRGEQYILNNRRIPAWVKIRWRFMDWAARTVGQLAT